MSSHIVFDWDDTLLCTTFLDSHGYSPLKNEPLPKNIPMLKELEESVYRILVAALERAQRVYIITNSDLGWVQLSARYYMPGILPLLVSIYVISAKHRYQHQFLHSHDWKAHSIKN